MYYKTIEKEQEFLWELWRIFNNWVPKSNSCTELGSEIVECGLLCPKCKTGRIINYGTISCNRNGHSFSMRHLCEQCHEEFDRVKMEEDIYNHTPHEMLMELVTPLGKFCAFRNEKQIPLRYWMVKTEIDGIEMITHRIDIDTSFMEKGDIVFAGIRGAGFVSTGSDERCTYISAENEEWFLMINGEDIIDLEVDIKDYSFITDNIDENGFTYLIHRDPADYSEKVSRFCRVISFCIAWGRKDLYKNYEEIIEQAIW